MRIPSLAAVLALFVSPAATGTSAGCLPPMTCTLVGYENGLQVDLDVPDAPATYRVEVEAEGEVLALVYEFTAERARCLACTATGERLRLDDSFPRDGLGLAVNIGRTDNKGGPRTATVRVLRGDALVAEDTFEPRYETDEPNGPGCGEHVFAAADLVVP
jgi:hypothetical protein